MSWHDAYSYTCRLRLVMIRRKKKKTLQQRLDKMNIFSMKIGNILDCTIII